MHRPVIAALIAAASLVASLAALAQMRDHMMHAPGDARQAVAMPPEMKAHMLNNMRGHLTALGEIQAALAARKFEQAADIAENQIGMSSLAAHGASHLAPYFPAAMQQMGTSMHRTASRFARIAQEASVDDNLPKALAALADLTQKCTACQATYRLE